MCEEGLPLRRLLRQTAAHGLLPAPWPVEVLATRPPFCPVCVRRLYDVQRGMTRGL
ncbi:MAG: hypothetical protein GTO26_03065 [Planctomycetales bacterium]|nr:hypothetical protein [Planctomycetales bacterium]NIN76764.1 hypothetical protein [Planctomycetales bacterium]NIO33973.1 hypothetical protein [Planctomycetales bacterium]NIO45757.1 hypothetical protein [Planctomycetales bacterium]